MTPKGWPLLLGAVFVALASRLCAQKGSSWRAYRGADGLAGSACISVWVGPSGRVFARHLNAVSISQLDGYTVRVIPAPETGSSRVYESPGGQLWTVTPEGLQEFKDEVWVRHPVAEIAAAFRAGLPRPVHPIPLCPVRQGHLLFLLPDGLIEYNAELPNSPQTRTLRAAAPTEKFTGMMLARDGSLWIASTRGLARAPGPARSLTPESQWEEFIAGESLQVRGLFDPREDPDGGITALAESAVQSQKTAVRFDGQQWAVEPGGIEKMRHAWRSPGPTFWSATIDRLFSREPGSADMAENEEISARQFFDVAVEPGGAFWLATSDGLFRHARPTWRTPASVRQIGSVVHGIASDVEGRLWFVAGNALHSLKDGQRQEYPFPSAAAHSLRAVRAIFALKDATFLLDAGDELFRFTPGSGDFKGVPKRDPATGLKPLGLVNDGRLCVLLSGANPTRQLRFELYDGSRFESFAAPPPDIGRLGEATLPPPPEDFLSGEFHVLFATQKGDLWLGGDRAVAWYHDNKWRAFSATDKSAPAAGLGFVELADGRIWCAAEDQIWEFDGRNWSALRRGFDRISAMLRTRDGSVWVASAGGLHRFFRDAWIENGVEEGLPAADVRQLHEDSRGRLWAGTTRGLGLYHPEADPDPPATHVQNSAESQGDVPEGGTVTLAFSGRDKWKHTPAERLLYSYRLDDGEWSRFAAADTISFSDLPAGKHYFQARAMDRNGNVDPKPAALEFSVILPWYKETRLVLISLAGLTAALFCAALAINRHRQLLRSYAAVEEKVAERTRQLEVAGRELLHSQKMNALGTLAAGIAHDFNNILSIIKGSAQIIEENLDNPQKLRTRVDRIKTVVEQGAGIVQAMLGFSRSSEQQTSLCDLNEVVADTITLLGDRFLREVEVSFEPAQDIPQVTAPKDFVQQILLNFIFNAAESMTERKRVIITTRKLDESPAGMVLKPVHGAACVAISVRDFGCGIPPENMSRIFDPFFTTKALSTRRGTGLGLSMAYELAKKMEAGLAVESVVAHGSTFVLVVPVRDFPPAAKASSREAVSISQQP